MVFILGKGNDHNCIIWPILGCVKEIKGTDPKYQSNWPILGTESLKNISFHGTFQTDGFCSAIFDEGYRGDEAKMDPCKGKWAGGTGVVRACLDCRSGRFSFPFVKLFMNYLCFFCYWRIELNVVFLNRRWMVFAGLVFLGFSSSSQACQLVVFPRSWAPLQQFIRSLNGARPRNRMDETKGRGMKQECIDKFCWVSNEAWQLLDWALSIFVYPKSGLAEPGLPKEASLTFFKIAKNPKPSEVQTV